MKNETFLHAIICIVIGTSAHSWAQSDSLQIRQLAPVVVTSSRLATSENRLPMALTVVDGNRIKIGQQQISLFESLGNVPGLFAQNPDNYAQDLRISIRGFGARAAFGIRGIRLLVDGIPESTPDGQADVDNIDPAAIGRMEVMRGPASSLYGNAAGGVLNLQTDNAADLPIVEARVSVGSYGFRNIAFKTAYQKGIFQYVLSASRNETDGFRAHSRSENNIINAKLRFDFDSLTQLAVLVNYGNSPVADDPGGLTAQQASENRQQAHPNNLRFNAGEAVSQGRVGLTFEKKMGKHLVYARGFGTQRAFTNLLAFQAAGAGSIDRIFGGGSVQYQFSDRWGNLGYRARMGFDAETQNDTRRRFDNINGERGKTTFDQLEQFRSTAFYLTQELTAGKITLLTGLRYDRIRQFVTDNFLTDGNQSGGRNYATINPTLGLSYQLAKPASVYANVGSSFETPTMSELSNNPLGTGGFNPDLNPQKALNMEIGTKLFLSRSVRIDLALFNVNVSDELVPYQIVGQAGRTFYRNAGSSKRQGVELGINAILAKGLTLVANYTYSDFRYATYRSTVGTVTNTFDGNTLPGVPKTSVYGELRYFQEKGLFAIAQLRHASPLFADDANAVTANDYTLANLRLGHHFSAGRVSFEPYLGVNNLFEVSYFQNVQINAATTRYFEPAVGRYWFGGLKIAVNKK